MNFVLFDEIDNWKNFLPLTFTKPISEIRVGILTIKQKWDIALNTNCSYLSQSYLEKKYPVLINPENIFINSKYCPNSNIVELINNLKPNQCICSDKKIIAFYGNTNDFKLLNNFQKIVFSDSIFELSNVCDIYQKNAEALINDFKIITKNKTSLPLSETVRVIGDKNLVFLEAGAKAEACIFNTTNGPIYLGLNSEVMEGSAVRGPFALGDNSMLKLNTKIYGATTIGPHCKIGGEINNSVVFGYSNKAHDGFLGNSVIGEWCNLGADTNSSNLKNNYSHVKLYNYLQKKSIDTGLQFCGLIMGDYSKSGINTMFNTGSVVGVGTNIFGAGFPPTYIPNFSWGGSNGIEKYRIDKLIETTEKVFERRGLSFNQIEKELLNSILSFNE